MRNSKSISKYSACIREPQTVRLQRDIETITQSLEYEKRESVYLDEQMKLLKLEMESMGKSKEKTSSNIKPTIALLQKKLELEKNQLNQTRYKNKQLRDQINEYRLDKSAHKQSLLVIKENLEKTSKAAEEQYEEYLRKNEEDSAQREKIGMLRSRSASQRSKYDERISTLVSFLRTGNSKSKLMYEDKNYPLQGIEVINILKKMLKKSEMATLEKKRNKDQYLRHINNLNSGFEQIKIATGMNAIEDIVTSCIKSEDQGQAILFYFNNLNSEIEVLQETLKLNTSKIQMLEGSKQQGNLSIQEFIKKNEDNYKTLQQKMKEKQEKAISLSTIIQEILPIIKKTHQLLHKMNLKVYKTSNDDINAIDKLNQENSNILLGEIEDHIAYLLVGLAYKSQSSLLLYPNLNKDKARNQSVKNNEIKDLIEDNDLYDEPDLEEIKVPITLSEMKLKAQSIFEKRRNMIKVATPEANPRHSRPRPKDGL
jgi:hypothetical protein